MAIILRDPSVYSLVSEEMRTGKNKGVPLEILLEEMPDYIQYLLDNKYIALVGEAAEAYRLALVKLENKERDGEAAHDDPFGSIFDDGYNESIADYLD